MYQMPSVIVIGGGLAGLSAEAALGSAGVRVEVFEARPFLGGRATSFPLAPSDEASELIDNCQHVLLRCCVNLVDFYGRLGVRESIRFYREYYSIEPGGRVSTLRRGVLPAPLHFTGSFLRLRFLDAGDKMAIARGLLALRRERTRRDDLDRISMLEWLREKRQTPRAIERFWRQVLVSAINEDVDRLAARHGFQVFWLGFLARADSYEMGVPAPAFEHSPITGIHLWFDRPVTDLPHATLLDRTIQWMFNKSEGRYLQLVVSASRGLAPTSRGDIVALAIRE